MAFLNEVGKVIGKAQQGLSDAAQTISTAAQETREEIAKALGSDDNAEKIIEWLTAAQKDLMESGALISSNAVCIR